MAITRNNTQSSSTSTLLYTPPSVTDGCLVVIVSSEDVGNNEPITGVSFGSNAMVVESVGQGIIGTNSNDIAIAYLVNPGITEESISVAGGQQDRMGIVAVTLDNVDQSSPVNVSNGSFSTAAVSVFPTSETTTLDGCYVISGGTGESTGGSLSVSGATEFIEFTPPSSRLAAADSTQASSGLYSHSWSTSSLAGRYSSASVAFNLAAGGIAAGISETGPSFTESITSILGVNISASISEAGPSFSESINTTVTSLTIQASITESGPSFTENINTLVTPSLSINASISEVGPSFSESITANLDANISVSIAEYGPSFTEFVSAKITKDTKAAISEQGPSFSDLITANIPVKITVNQKNIVRVKRRTNTVTIKRKTNIIRVK